MSDPADKLTGVYVNGVKVKEICSSSWGIGVYTVEFADGAAPIYGFPPTNMDPHDFSPDRESCTPEEIAAWKAACDAWESK